MLLKRERNVTRFFCFNSPLIKSALDFTETGSLPTIPSNAFLGGGSFRTFLSSTDKKAC